MAKLTERAESTVRNWSNPNTRESVPLDCAIVLDLEFQRSGGVGAPLNDVYALLLKTGAEQRFACQAEIAAATIAEVKESGEAFAAQIAATLPGADEATIERAIKEKEEDIAAATRTLALLRAARKPP
ncbi:hypothetical protein [uncultured Sphingomonas sp.]|uniref:hypothetical protein n=1 Tax=uncultured Sphingomonas sp. TaxID=158754 RepID=UPI0025ED37E8|nr:hypothetical protein [uncultured Sphingomonas sp.]